MLGQARGTDVALRPARLTFWVQFFLFLCLGGSFASGILVWHGQTLQEAAEPAPWLRGALVVHGCLNPFLCGIFGFLVAQHFRASWALKANRVSGVGMELLYLALILSGVGLYYWGGEEGRRWLGWSHRILGLFLPLAMGIHIWKGRAWIRERAAEARG